MSNERWRDSYDQWKTATPPEYDEDRADEDDAPQDEGEMPVVVKQPDWPDPMKLALHIVLSGDQWATVGQILLTASGNPCKEAVEQIRQQLIQVGYYREEYL